MKQLVVADVAALEQWRRLLGSVLWRRDLPQVEFRLAALSTPYNQNYSILANELRRACGCASSGLGMSLAVVWLGFRFFNSAAELSMPGLGEYLSALGIVLAAAAGGKLLGILVSRWRLLRLAARIRSHYGRCGDGTVMDSY